LRDFCSPLCDRFSPVSVVEEDDREDDEDQEPAVIREPDEDE
jgi:hypothetical protein